MHSTEHLWEFSSLCASAYLFLWSSLLFPSSKQLHLQLLKGSLSLCRCVTRPLSAASGVSLSSPLCSRPASNFNQKPHCLIPILRNNCIKHLINRYVLLISLLPSLLSCNGLNILSCLLRFCRIRGFWVCTMHCISIFKCYSSTALMLLFTFGLRWVYVSPYPAHIPFPVHASARPP